eukprot:7890632-Alexandrium_andersonii.AAC.1
MNFRHASIPHNSQQPVTPTTRAIQVMKRVLFAPGAVTTKAHCVVHGRACAAEPALVHIAGPPCVDW